MHIPDGYLSPATAIVAYGAAMPFWYQASRRVKETLRGQAAPLVAVFAAFSFTLQMFNIPVPGGTTAHAVGGTLMAAVLGPWPAVVGLSIVLVIQALFFGDGGITAIGANCFNMAVALPLTGYAVYRLLAGSSAPSPRRRVAAAAIGSYVGINVAGLLTALELGIQPLFWSVGGKALYNPYSLEITVPAMLSVHLTLVGFAEAAVTGLAVAYLLRTQPGLLVDPLGGSAAQRLGKAGWSLVGVLGLLVLLTPLGLIAPGGADFEWAAEELHGMVGYVPAGLLELSELWKLTPLPEYQLPGTGPEASFFQQAPAYILSALIGVGLIFAVIFAVRIALARRGVVATER